MTDELNTNAGAGPVEQGVRPLLAEADMTALEAVAHQAGLTGVDLHALARVLDAAQTIAVAEEREHWKTLLFGPHLYRGECPTPDSDPIHWRDAECPACRALGKWVA